MSVSLSILATKGFIMHWQSKFVSFEALLRCSHATACFTPSVFLQVPKFVCILTLPGSECKQAAEDFSQAETHGSTFVQRLHPCKRVGFWGFARDPSGHFFYHNQKKEIPDKIVWLLSVHFESVILPACIPKVSVAAERMQKNPSFRSGSFESESAFMRVAAVTASNGWSRYSSISGLVLVRLQVATVLMIFVSPLSDGQVGVRFLWYHSDAKEPFAIWEQELQAFSAHPSAVLMGDRRISGWLIYQWHQSKAFCQHGAADLGDVRL